MTTEIPNKDSQETADKGTMISFRAEPEVAEYVFDQKEKEGRAIQFTMNRLAKDSIARERRNKQAKQRKAA